MKNIIIFLIIFIFSHSLLSGQCFKIDSLQRALFIVKNDSARVNTMIALANEFIINKYPGKATIFAQEAEAISKRINYQPGIVDAKIVRADILSQDKLKYDEAIKAYEDALSIAEKAGNPRKIAFVYKKTGQFYFEKFYIQKGYYEKALDYYQKHLKIVEELDDKELMAEAYLMIGEIQGQMNNEKEALTYFLKAIDLQKARRDTLMNDTRLIANTQRYYLQRIENQKLYNYIFIGGILFLGLLVSLLIISTLQKVRNNRILQKQKEEIKLQRDQIEIKNNELEEQTRQISEQRDQLSIVKDQLTEQNKQIKEAEEKLKLANEKLKATNFDLEEEVQKRTLDLMKLNVALTESNEELDLLIYRASHDFKGPLATLIGLTQVAKIESTDSKALDFFGKIEATAHKMDGMLNKLHQVSYIIDKIPDNKIVDFDQIFANVQKHLFPLTEGSPFRFTLENNNVIHFICDPEVLEIIFENLMENSVIFRTQNNGKIPTLNINIINHVSYIDIEFKDNGIGIQEEFIPKVFDMFFRGSEESTGNGLGLYVVSKAVERLSGEITVDSLSGEYTHFTLKLPK